MKEIIIFFKPLYILIKYYLIPIILYILPLFISIAFYTLIERKIMGSIQRRQGPSIVGFIGLLQAISDGLKLIIKEIIIPKKANNLIFFFSPLLTLIISLVSWFFISFSTSYSILNVELSLIYILVLSSFNIFGIIGAGWSSNSKYAFLGSIWSAAQMISYEVSIGFIFITVALISGSYNINVIVNSQKELWYCFPLLPLVIIFFISILAETNRAPFDLPEAEAEIVAGYNVEYSSITFAMFFLGEYANMLLMSALMVILFFGGWLNPICPYFDGPFIFIVKILIISFLFVIVRATFPRLRYDQLMDLGWKIFLPFTLAFLLFISFYLYYFKAFPLKLESIYIYR